MNTVPELEMREPDSEVSRPRNSILGRLTRAGSATLYLFATFALLATIGGASRFGNSFDFVGHWEFPRWVAFFTVLPTSLLLSFAILTLLDTNRRRNLRPHLGVMILGLLIFGFFSLIAILSVNLAFDGGWTTRHPDALSSRTRAAAWLGSMYFIACFAYFAYAIFTRLVPPRRDSRATHWLIGVIPTLLISAFALIIFLSDRGSL